MPSRSQHICNCHFRIQSQLFVLYIFLSLLYTRTHFLSELNKFFTWICIFTILCVLWKIPLKNGMFLYFRYIIYIGIEHIPLFVLWFQFWISFSIFSGCSSSAAWNTNIQNIVYFAVAIKLLCGKYVTYSPICAYVSSVCARFYFSSFFFFLFIESYRKWILNVIDEGNKKKKTCQRHIFKKDKKKTGIFIFDAFKRKELGEDIFRQPNEMVER